jgi:hypothetical protein
VNLLLCDIRFAMLNFILSSSEACEKFILRSKSDRRSELADELGSSASQVDEGKSRRTKRTYQNKMFPR